jgi:hypothetical protein
MPGQTAAEVARITLSQSVTYGTIAPKVVTHRMHLLIRAMLGVYTMRQPLLSVYQIMAEDHVRKNVGECHPYREFEGMQPSR